MIGILISGCNQTKSESKSESNDDAMMEAYRRIDTVKASGSPAEICAEYGRATETALQEGSDSYESFRGLRDIECRDAKKGREAVEAVEGAIDDL